MNPRHSAAFPEALESLTNEKIKTKITIKIKSQ